ncbi:endoribonuclease MazF [Shimazuella alba]|uniref:endoribonuclease MazF n=1 Tax=Shimazuella alba TaxID=2690964 RepID=UPI00308439D9
MSYIPKRGDIIWMNFDPQSGHEQAGRRPALVLSAHEYNEILGLAQVCPITSKTKGYPFEVQLPEDLKINGVVLSDQAKSIDWKARETSFIDECPVSTLTEVLSKLLVVIDPDELLL